MSKNAIRNAVGPLIGFTLFVAALWVLHRTLAGYSYQDIVTYVRSLPAQQIGLALILTGISYTNMAGYDLLAMRYLRRRLPWPKVGFATFVSYAFSNTIGMSVLISGSVRYRLYSSWGLTAIEVTKVVIFSTFTFWLGILTVGGSTLTLEPFALPAVLHLPFESIQALGAVMLAGPAIYVLLGIVRKDAIRVGNWELRIARPPLSLLQIWVGSLDWILAGSVLFVLLPPIDTLNFGQYLGLFLIAQILGLVSHVPGGLGVFESAILFLLAGRVPAADVLGALLGYRLVYYLVPLLLATLSLGLHEALRHKERVLRLPQVVTSWMPIMLPYVLSIMTLVSGAVLLFSLATPAVDERLQWLSNIVTLPALELSNFLASLAGAGLLLLARGLQRRLDIAYVLTVLILVIAIGLCLLKGGDYEEALLLGVLLFALLPSRRHFYRRSSLVAEPFTAAWIVTIVLVLLCTIWIGMFSYKQVLYSHDLWWQFTLGQDGNASRFLRAMAGANAVVLAFALAKLLRPATYQPTRPGPTELAQASSVISQSDRTYAHLALLGDKALLFNKHRNAFIMYGAEGRSCVAMGDPVGPPDARRELAWEFRELCERLGTWTVFYQAHPENLDLYLELGLTLLKIGDEARVHLPGFSLEGNARKGMRATRERLERGGYRMEVVPQGAVYAILPDLNQISSTWLAQKRSREKGFSLGFFTKDYLTAGPVALVRQGDKTVAFANLWLGRDTEELSIDLMRFVPEAPKDVEDYLLIELIHWGQAKRYKWFNLGMAPLTGLHNRSLAPRWNRFGAIAFGQGERHYNFQGLRQYKERFGPCWESRFLASPGGIALPHILANVTALIGGGLSRTVHQ